MIGKLSHYSDEPTRIGADAEVLLRRISEWSPTFAADVRRFASLTVAEYLDQLTIPDSSASNRGGIAEVAEVVRQLALPLYGPTLADRAAEEMVIDPVVATANHAGLDTLADSFHSTLLYGMRGQQCLPGRRTVVVLGCGVVSLNNPSFPMGLLYYEHGGRGTVASRFSLLPRTQRPCMVRTARRLTREDMDRARARLNAATDSEISARSTKDLQRALNEDIDLPEIHDAPSFDDQCRLINGRLWNRCVPDSLPQPVYVEHEQVAAELLTRDLVEHSSLIYPLIFDPGARGRFVQALDGIRTCWQTELLENGDPRGGTHLFWTISPKGHRVPLVLRSDAETSRLVEISAASEPRSWELAPELLAHAVAVGELIPSAPLCFTTISFARGVGPLGGYFQFDYLPKIHRATLSAVGADGLTSTLECAPTQLYIAGVHGVLGRDPNNRHHLPVGQVALASTGRLSQLELGRIRQAPMWEAQVAGMSEILPDLIPTSETIESDIASLNRALAACCMVVRDLPYE